MTISMVIPVPVATADPRNAAAGQTGICRRAAAISANPDTEASPRVGAAP